MATYNTLGVANDSMIAGGTIAQYRAVKLDSTENQIIATAAITDVAIGASTTSGSSGDLVTIQRFGRVKLTAAAAISLGAQVMPDSGGGGKIATASGATAVSIGIARQAAGADGDVIEVELQAPNLKGPANS